MSLESVISRSTENASKVDQPSKRSCQDSLLKIDDNALAQGNSLRFLSQIPFSRWKKIGEQLSTLANASAWWLGDWLVYGETRYPERYKQAVKETTLDYQTLRNYAWISRKIDKSRRRGTLSFQHHAEVASLPEDEQEEWLDRAEKFGWSRNLLRQYLRVHRETSANSREGRPAEGVVIQVNVPSGEEERWQEAAKKMDRPLDEWMILMLSRVADALLRGKNEIVVQPK
ncbi:LmbU family transcriptional regulator [Actinomadura sp. 3N407]|uniref:LmbU family transcriptional regulator n=1 Tax=Actinomadura sp. 3N407 TaxID=3457423 RepID=UPI003FCC29CC